LTAADNLRPAAEKEKRKPTEYKGWTPPLRSVSDGIWCPINLPGQQSFIQCDDGQVLALSYPK
jgi:hypothetical protein